MEKTIKLELTLEELNLIKNWWYNWLSFGAFSKKDKDLAKKIIEIIKKLSKNNDK